MIKIAPSILSADFARLESELDTVKTADLLHCDVMDGLFVPNISFGIPVLKRVREITGLIMDTHLMIERPLRYVEQFAKLGSDIITVHAEADQPRQIIEALEEIRRQGKKSGISIKPGTPAAVLEPYMDLVDMILVMTVEPGFGGQSFMGDMLPKISCVRRMIEERGLDIDVEVDGGINADTAKLCVDAGANVLVAGSTIFGAASRPEAISSLRGNA